MKMKKILASFYTDLCADSVEWCPHDPFKNIFVCGLYEKDYHLKLEFNFKEFDVLFAKTDDPKSPENRYGKILLFSFTDDEQLRLTQEVKSDAILDQKWNLNRPILATSTSKNSIKFYELNSSSSTYQLEEMAYLRDINYHCDDVLILSLDWSKSDKIICSDSKGYVHLIQFSNSSLSLLNTWHCHEFETWISTFDHSDQHLFYSGGDDSKLQMYDERITAKPIAEINEHTSGVTSLHTNRKSEHQLASGSYDENIFVWDTRNVNKHLMNKKMSAGVWRLKWHPFSSTKLLAACMLSGFHVLEQNGNLELQCDVHLDEHRSLAYGADWCYRLDTDIVATCSFYDKYLCVSQIDYNYNNQ